MRFNILAYQLKYGDVKNIKFKLDILKRTSIKMV